MTDSQFRITDNKFLNKGPEHEELNCDLRGQDLPAKLLAYYLPQFYPSPENDEWWGKGFTEWTNVTRGRPRFEGHYQPHLPADLGYYDLRVVDVMRKQAEYAQRAGIHGWCFYYYRFGEKRLLDKPVDNLLKEKDINMPFTLMWANQSWTKAWVGHNENVLIEQTYDPAYDDEFIDDLARHFNDERYIRIDGKPLFYIYNPSEIPNAKERIESWRELLLKRHQIEIIIYMVQYKTRNPKRFGLDGAIEFPPHKLLMGVEKLDINNSSELPLLPKDSKSNFCRYEDLISSSLAEPVPVGYDLTKCLCPTWDCEPRRPNEALIR